ncbi:MAG: chorismate mutase [Thermaerobacter sp.]|nr:chorismate mutase [Thermaerobacter sp.]
MIRGIRGATTVEHDTAEEILSRTEALIEEMARVNQLEPEQLSSICFTMTPDLHATFPAEAARRVGWRFVPVICMQELDVPHGLRQTIRVLMMAETDRTQPEVRHVYQHGAVVLREDLVSPKDGLR